MMSAVADHPFIASCLPATLDEESWGERGLNLYLIALTVKYNLRHRAPEATAAPGEELRRGADAGPQRLLALAPPRRVASIGPRPSTNVARSP
jgi:hypothetical protein